MGVRDGVVMVVMSLVTSSLISQANESEAGSSKRGLPFMWCWWRRAIRQRKCVCTEAGESFQKPCDKTHKEDAQ